MDDCIFCKIVNKEIPAEIVEETDVWLAFRDVNPQAPVHALLIPKKHHKDIGAMDDPLEIGELVKGAVEVAKKLGLEDGGFRIVNNLGVNGGQTVFHTHLHILGGRRLGWPPG